VDNLWKNRYVFVIFFLLTTATDWVGCLPTTQNKAFFAKAGAGERTMVLELASGCYFGTCLGWWGG
jgi:hypothetical protein